MKFSRYLPVLILIFLLSCSGTEFMQNTVPSKSLVRQIDAIVHDESFAHAHWGVLIKSLDTDRIWYAHDAEKLFMPASNNKIPSTAAAMMVLGPDFTFTTQLMSKAAIKNGVLEGDLVVWSNGDPTQYEKYMDDSRAVFIQHAQKLKELGVREIHGNIIGDDNAFDDEHIGEGWCLDYLQTWYAAPFGALQFNENYVDFRLFPPASEEEGVKIVPNVESSYFTIENHLEVVEDGVTDMDVQRDYGSNVIRFTGTVQAGGSPFWKTVSIWNPTAFYVHVLKETLESEGIKVCGKAKDCDEIPNWVHAPEDAGYSILNTYNSIPLSQVITHCLKRSQNMYAETMPRVTSWYETGLGEFSKGREIADSVFVQFGVEPGTWIYSDGSGLNRYNFISPSVEVKILEGMYRQEELRDMWINALPLAGHDGTLKRRMKGTAAEGRVMAKTGTISNVRGLSGYAKTACGENIVFSFLVNGHRLTSKDTERITDAILELICAYPGK